MQLVRIKGTGFGVYRRADGRYLVKYRDSLDRARQKTFSKTAEANSFCRQAYRAWPGRQPGRVGYTVAELVGDYLGHREDAHRAGDLADNTITRDRSAARRVLKRWPNAQAADLSRFEVRGWCSAMRKESPPLTSRTVAGYASFLRSAYRWSMDGGMLEGLTKHPVPPVKVDDRPRSRALSLSEVIDIIKTMPSGYVTFTEALAFTGFRIQELCRLDIADWDRANATLRGGMKTKEGTGRLVAIPDWLNRDLRRYVGDRTDGPLFLNRHGRRVNVDVYRLRIWNPAVARVGVPEATPHWLRHTLATLLAEHGMSVYRLRSHFGWARSDIADHYVKRANAQRSIADTIQGWGSVVQAGAGIGESPGGG